ncbi:MAG TPA: hypothetical protein VIJ01_06095 [Candidatus Angelobacter sp.]|jgi:hypothetical protein
MRKQLSAPVSLMLVVIGFALIYYVFHTNGWSWNGEDSLGYVYRGMLYQSRVLVIIGFVLTAWGLGSLINALLAGRRDDQPPPVA